MRTRDWADSIASQIFSHYDLAKCDVADVAVLIREAYAAQPRPGIQARAEAAARAIDANYIDAIATEGRQTRLSVQGLTSLIVRHFSDLEPQAELRLAVEFGFRCHEKGMNLEAALDKVKGE